MNSPMLPRIRDKLIEAIRWASTQQALESGWPLHAPLQAGALPDEGRAAANGRTVPQKREDPPMDVHIDEDEASPPPKIIPGSYGQEEDEDGYQRGNWRREPFTTIIIAGNSNDEDEPPGGDQDAGAPEPVTAPEAVVTEEGAGQEETPQAEVVEASALGGDADAEVPDQPEADAQASPVNEVRTVHAIARILHRIPAPPSTGTRGSWEQDRKPWFTGRWGKQNRATGS